MGSIYRHNEGGAPLAVAECALRFAGRLVARLMCLCKRSIESLRDCCGSDILSGLAGGLNSCRVLPGFDGGLCHGRFFDNFIWKKEKRGRQGPAECPIGMFKADTLADTFREKI